MNPPVSFITPSPQIPYRQIEAWYEDCVRAARQIKGAEAPKDLLALKSRGNQISLIYALAGATDRAQWVLRETLRCVEPHCLDSTELRLAAASLHQNLTRLALRAGTLDLATHHIDRMFLAEGLGEDAALQNFIAFFNAHHVAVHGDDAPYLAAYRRGAPTEYAAAVRQEAALIFLLRSGQYEAARKLATENLFAAQGYNVMLQLYILLIEMRDHPASRFASDVSLMVEEIASEETACDSDGIAVTKLLFRLCSIASLCEDPTSRTCVALMERIGTRWADYYVKNAGALFLSGAPVASPFHIELRHREMVKAHAQSAAARTDYDRELTRIAG